MSMIEVRNHKGDVVATFPSNYTFHFTVSTPAIRRGLFPKPPVQEPNRSSVIEWLDLVGAVPSSDAGDRKCRTTLYRHYAKFAGGKALSAQHFYATLVEEGFAKHRTAEGRYFGMQLTNVTSKLG
jgi:hypothetical protein